MNEKDTRKVDQSKYKSKRKYFKLSGKLLAQYAKEGDEKAQKELDRRAKKKAAKKKKEI